MTNEIINYKVESRNVSDMTKYGGLQKIAYELLFLFKDHIGEQNAIKKAEIFKYVYKKTYNSKDLSHVVMMQFITEAMGILRRRSNCFIIKIKDFDTEGYPTYLYFVPKTEEEANYFAHDTDYRINVLKARKERCYKSVREEWHKQNWHIGTPTKQIK